MKDEALPEYDWTQNINSAPRMVNESFSDNPMYPFTVAEVATITVSLYQSDKKWAGERVTVDGGNAVTYQRWVNRHARLVSCMKYPVAIGFVIVRLWGPKVRCSGTLYQPISISPYYLHMFTNICMYVCMYV